MWRGDRRTDGFRSCEGEGAAQGLEGGGDAGGRAEGRGDRARDRADRVGREAVGLESLRDQVGGVVAVVGQQVGVVVLSGHC